MQRGNELQIQRSETLDTGSRISLHRSTNYFSPRLPGIIVEEEINPIGLIETWKLNRMNFKYAKPDEISNRINEFKARANSPDERLKAVKLFTEFEGKTVVMCFNLVKRNTTKTYRRGWEFINKVIKLMVF